jgi:outer membrane protein assembly factor BamB
MQRWNPCENVLGVNNVGNLGVKWSYDTLYFSVNSSPTVANGVVYIISDQMYALNAKTAKLWSYAIGSGRYTSSPAGVNGVVYIGLERARCTRGTPVPEPTYGPSPLATV